MKTSFNFILESGKIPLLRQTETIKGNSNPRDVTPQETGYTDTGNMKGKKGK